MLPRFLLLSTKRRVSCLLTISFVFCFLSLSQFVNAQIFEPTRFFEKQTEKLFEQPTDNPDEKPHYLVAAYYDVQNFPTAKLLLNNKGLQTVEIRPTLYNSDGIIMEVAPVFVAPSSYKFVDLREWANLGGESFRRGSLKIFHTGKDLVIGTQIYLEDEARSLSFEEKFSELGTFDSRRLEGVWFQPSNQTESKIILTNTSDELLTVSATLSRRPHVSGSPQTFILQPHQMRMIDVRETFGNGYGNSDALGISLTHDGATHALLARALISEPAKGYSTAVTFSNPNRAKSNELHGAGLKLGTIGNDALNPILILRNTGGENTIVKVRIPYTRTDGTNRTLTIDDVNLRGNEIKQINLDAISQIAGQGVIETAGIEIQNQAENGNVIAQMQTISQTRRQSFRVLLWDAPAQKKRDGRLSVAG